MLIACRKRRVPVEDLRDAVERIERTLYKEFEDEVPSTKVGDLVLRMLADIDTVAYIRFASVYRQFETLGDFQRMVQAVMDDGRAVGARPR